MARKDLGRMLLSLLSAGGLVEAIHLRVYCGDSAQKLKRQREQARDEQQEHPARLQKRARQDAAVEPSTQLIGEPTHVLQQRIEEPVELSQQRTAPPTLVVGDADTGLVEEIQPAVSAPAQSQSNENRIPSLFGNVDASVSEFIPPEPIASPVISSNFDFLLSK